MNCFWQGAKQRWIPVQEVASAIGPAKISGILYFQAFTGYDVVSAFRWKGKKSAWLTWDVCDEVSETFTKLSHCPTEVSDDGLQKLEKFIVLMYDRSSSASGVYEARLVLFACKQKTYDAIPPTRGALKEHAKRAAYQAGIIWGQAIVTNPETCSPADWGWTQNGDTWQICWTTLGKLPETNQVFLQEGLQPEMQVFSLRASCHALCSCVCEE